MHILIMCGSVFFPFHASSSFCAFVFKKNLNKICKSLIKKSVKRKCRIHLIFHVPHTRCTYLHDYTHVSTCSQIQSSHGWFGGTTKELHDGWKMSHVHWPTTSRPSSASTFLTTFFEACSPVWHVWSWLNPCTPISCSHVQLVSSVLYAH